MPNRPSRTSQKLAGLILMTGTYAKWSWILSENVAEAQRRRLAELNLYPRLRFRLYEQGWFHRIISLLDRVFLQSQLVYMVLRKRFFEDRIQAELEQGATQVVILGAGLDPGGIRLAGNHPEIRVWEIDRVSLPISQSGNANPENLHRITANLADPTWTTQLQSHPYWQSTAKTVFAAEGLLMYLEADAVRRLLGALKQMTPYRGSFYFSFLRTSAWGKPRYGNFSPLVRLGLSLVGEPLRWSINPEEISTFLGQEGLTSERTPDEADLYQLYLSTHPIWRNHPKPTIEFLAHAKWPKSDAGQHP